MKLQGYVIKTVIKLDDYEFENATEYKLEGSATGETELTIKMIIMDSGIKLDKEKTVESRPFDAEVFYEAISEEIRKNV